MPTFTAPDGTELAYHVADGETGSGVPVVCLPGGPMLASAYLGDLGGLAAHRRLALLDLRGTGDSAGPADPASYRCDRQVADVEALREHLGLERVDLLGHSAGVSLAVRYAAEHPRRIGRLALIAPSTKAVGIEMTAERRRRILTLRQDEPWYPTASAAFDRIAAGQAGDDDWSAIDPVYYGRWDAAARAHLAAQADQRNDEAARIFIADGAFDPPATRAAMGKIDAPVLLLAGGIDWNLDEAAAAEFAGLFPDARIVVQPGAGHYPWLDDAAAFAGTVARFLG